MRRHVFAYTAPGSRYPEYVSVTDGAGGLEIVVRAPAYDRACGPTAAITLARPAAAELVRALMAALCDVVA